MNIYLIHNDYEGCDTIAFSTQELAEQYTLKNGGDVVRVVLDSNEYEWLEQSPAMVAKVQRERDERARAYAEWRNEVYPTIACFYCGVANKDCTCPTYIDHTCGDFGGMTKRGTACLNVTNAPENEGTRCHLHREMAV